MKSIIVFYSLEGNTKDTAEKLAGRLGADILELHPKKSYPTGKVSKFLWGGKSAVMSDTPELEPYAFNKDLYDRIIIGSPIWASRVTPPIITFIQENNLTGKSIAVFACQSGNGAEKAFAKLKDQIGINAFAAELILIDPKTRSNSSNEGKINAFCDIVRSEKN